MIKIFTSRITYDGIIVEGEEPSEIFELDNERGLIAASPLKYKLKITPINGGYLATGSAEAIFELICDKCLAHFKERVKNSDICHLYENYHASELDLTEDIREDILILLPHRFMCSESCKGICFKCGTNLNIKQCSCHDTEKPDSVWNELNNLKI
ncbi:MAG TPA: hypothetical protein DD381_09085 [Lentisphaeria bacterium]|nr:MAG: hypothetical protein A2X47_07775 [Lentisphaerae bacterium GWF2_38_69]HBM16476.1 hypothetical protein [Lentisphaeria bacterium]